MEPTPDKVRTRQGLLTGIGLLALTQPVVAQFVQYTPAGFFEPRRESTEVVLERHIDEARWKVGRLFLDPWVGMRDSGYRDPAAGTDESDVTLTVGFGARGWLPLGSDFTLAAHVLPEYTWWNKFSERNSWNGRYGTGLFGNLGRTGVELTASLDDYATFFSREFEEQVNTSRQQVEAKFEVDVGGGFEVLAGASLTALRYDDEEVVGQPSPSVVDRDEDLLSAGVNYQFPYGFKAGLGVEYSQARFDPGASDLSNSGVAPLLLLDFEGTQLFLTGDLAYRSLQRNGDSRFIDYEGLTGRLQVSWRTVERLELQLYASNQLVYSFSETWAYFEDAPFGLAVRYAFSRWFYARIFGEIGSDDYTAFAQTGPQRTDDFDSLGASVQFRINRLRLGLQISRTDYDSNLDTFDREFSRIGFLVGLGTGDGSSWR